MGCEDGPMAKSERDKFTSFRDLQRARGGGGQGEEAAQDAARAGRGYTLEGASSPEELEGGADPADGARERIDARPDASGAMQTGPPCYRDPDSDELELLHSFRARLCFPDDVEGEVARREGFRHGCESLGPATVSQAEDSSLAQVPQLGGEILHRFVLLVEAARAPVRFI